MHLRLLIVLALPRLAIPLLHLSKFKFQLLFPQLPPAQHQQLLLFYLLQSYLHLASQLVTQPLLPLSLIKASFPPV